MKTISAKILFFKKKIKHHIFIFLDSLVIENVKINV